MYANTKLFKTAWEKSRDRSLNIIYKTYNMLNVGFK